VSVNISNRAYNTLKWVALVGLPAVATCYAFIAGIWGISHTQDVIGSITAVDTCLGTLLGVSSKSYQKSTPSDGNLVIDKSDSERDNYSLELTTPFSEIDKRDQLVLNVTKPPRTPTVPSEVQNGSVSA